MLHIKKKNVQEYLVLWTEVADKTKRRHFQTPARTSRDVMHSFLGGKQMSSCPNRNMMSDTELLGVN